MPIYITPGPSHPYPKLRSYLDDAWESDVISWSHRGSQFTDLYHKADAVLRELMDIPDTHHILFLGSATEAMERLIEGLVRTHSHHVILGAFGEKWLQIANQLGKKTTATKLNPTSLKSAGHIKIPADTELICATLNETSNGVRASEAILKQLYRRPKDQLLALDIVSAAPLIRINWDHVDAAFFSVQKAFGLPAGLGVLIINDIALKRTRALQAAGQNIGSYHSLVSLADAASKQQTPETPNVLSIYLLARVAEDMLQIGISSIRDTIYHRSEVLYAELDSSRSMQPYVQLPSWRSSTVIVIDIPEGNSAFLDHLKHNSVIAGKGYATEHKDRHIRIANFPAISDQAFNEIVAQVRNW